MGNEGRNKPESVHPYRMVFISGSRHIISMINRAISDCMLLTESPVGNELSAWNMFE